MDQRSGNVKDFEARIALIKCCQLLEFKKIKSLPREELAIHMETVKAGNIHLPLRIRLDVLECQVDSAFMDYFAAEKMQVDAVKAMVDAIVLKFCAWEMSAPVDDTKLTAQAILRTEQEVLGARQKAREISKEEVAIEISTMCQAAWGLKTVTV